MVVDLSHSSFAKARRRSNHELFVRTVDPTPDYHLLPLEIAPNRQVGGKARKRERMLHALSGSGFKSAVRRQPESVDSVGRRKRHSSRQAWRGGGRDTPQDACRTFYGKTGWRIRLRGRMGRFSDLRSRFPVWKEKEKEENADQPQEKEGCRRKPCSATQRPLLFSSLSLVRSGSSLTPGRHVPPSGP